MALGEWVIASRCFEKTYFSSLQVSEFLFGRYRYRRNVRNWKDIGSGVHRSHSYTRSL